MKCLTNIRMGSAALRVALLAAMLMLAAGTSQAARDGGRGSGHGGRVSNGGGGRSYDGGGDHGRGGSIGRIVFGGGGQTNGGGGRSYGGGGGRSYNGGGGRGYGGGGHSQGGGRGYIGGGGRSYGGGGGYISGGRTYGGGGHYYGTRYRSPYRYRYSRPSTFVSFGIGLGLPYYYCPPRYRYVVERYPVPVEPSISIEVDNYPPAGCYYYDRFCDREFSNLDDYTDHIDSQDHARTIEIVRRDSGEVVRTLEFVDGYWSVER